MNTKKTVLLLLVSAIATASVLALSAPTFLQPFETPMIKSIKEKFTSFYKKLNPERLYVETDKTFYKPDETVWFSVFLKDEATFKNESASDIVHVELISPKGNTEKHLKIIAKDGIAAGDFDLAGLLGGIYKIKAYTEFQKNDINALLFEKEITIQSVVMPRLKMKMDFEQKAYGKSDVVNALLHLESNTNLPLANKDFSYKVKLDGNNYKDSKGTTDGKGDVKISFSLPDDLKTTDGVINILINYEGSTESISRSIPIVLNEITLNFFPEGGDLVADIKNNLAFAATNEFGKPADIAGVIVDENDKEIAPFSSYHNGMGVVNFVPQKDINYKAKITKPAGIDAIYNIPDAITKAYRLSAAATQRNVQLSIHTFQPETLNIIGQIRGKIYYAGSVNALKGENIVGINTAEMPIGVLQITLFDSKGIARAERLVFVNKDKQLNVSLTTNKKTYQPREKAAVSVRVTDENGMPVSGNFAVSVVDDNLLTYADDKQGMMRAKMLLESDLQQKVEEPNYYFEKNEKADKAIDLLMLTAGWRRYTWKQINSKDSVIINHRAERASLSGTVMNAQTNKPVAGAKLTLLKSKLSTTTDKDGKFELRGFTIAEDNQLEINAGKDLTSIQYIYDYQPDVVYYVGHRIYYDAMPMAAAGGVRKNVVQKNVGLAEKEGDMVEAQMMVEDIKMMPVNNIEYKKDQAPVVAIDEIQIEVAGYVAKEKIADGRADKIAFKKPAPEQPTYYRAKEFPKKTYAKDDLVRDDFETTLYWNGNLATDQNGKANFEFTTNDLVSSFNIKVSGFGDDGQIGENNQKFFTQMPFSMDVKMPSQLVVGDKIDLPVFLKNNTESPINGNVTVANTGCVIVANSSNPVTIPAMSNALVYIPVEAAVPADTCEVTLQFIGSNNIQTIELPIKVIAKGFPAAIALSSQEKSKDYAVNIQNMVSGSLQVKFTAYPNIMGELMKGVDAILREPHGCFEQTSSSNYPNIMALSYLRTMGVKDDATEKKAMDLLDKGYKKLIAFETKENGYEWFGAAPAHEALTAYGLMEFEDMRKVYPVDNAMIERTKKLLLDKRDGNGGFKKNPRALDSFGGADEDITNAYIVYALTESGYKDLEKELNALEKSATSSKDPYIMALAANAFFNVGNEKAGNEMLKMLDKAKNEYGSWTGKKHSITRSTGQALQLETTSLVALAIMKSKTANDNLLIGGIKYLVGSRSAIGGFSSTQATVLALKALTKYAEYSKKTTEAGDIEIYNNGKMIATKHYEKEAKGDIEIKDLAQFFKQGINNVSVQYKNTKSALPYTVAINYNTTLPASDKECKLDLTTTVVGDKKVKVGETIRLSTTLTNKTAEGQPMSVAIIGIPAGFTPQPWQLKELQDKKLVDFYEIFDNNVVCYYRALAPKAEKTINLDLKAEVPGSYDAPASSAYLYYTNENKVWRKIETVVVEK